MSVPARSSWRTNTDGRSVLSYTADATDGPDGPYAPVTLDQFVRSVTAGIQRGLDCVSALEIALAAAPWAAPYIGGAGTALATLCYAFPTVHEKVTAAEQYLRGLLARVI